MAVKYALLALLDRRPMYGYELKSEFAGEIGAHWSLNFGQVYTTLTKLEKSGLVVHKSVPGQNAPERKIYHITKGGQQALTEWFLTPIDKIESFKDEFYVKLMLSLTGAIDADQVLLTQKKAVYQKLHELNKLKQTANVDLQLPWVFLLDLAILHAEADIRWLEMCEARLDRLTEHKLETLGEIEPEPQRRRVVLDPDKKRQKDLR